MTVANIPAMPSHFFPALPRETARAAEAAFGQKNLYLLIGKSLPRLLDGIDLAPLYEPRIPNPFPSLYALVTLFQFAEGLADEQAEEATRVRVDWKYALHLPLTYPGIRPPALCEFRMRMFASEAGRASMQRMLERAAAESALHEVPFRGADALYLLETVCISNRVALLLGAMHAALQALAASDDEWLRDVVRPHWYQRYGREPPVLWMPDGFAQVELAESIGEDGFHLLEMASRSGKDWSGLEEIRTLERLWEIEYERWDGHLKWGARDCDRCMRRIRRA